MQNPEMTLHELDGECILYDNAEGKVHVLNHTAHFIWSQCTKAITADEVARRVQQNYEIDAETARTDAANTIQTFLDRSILTRVTDRAATG